MKYKIGDEVLIKVRLTSVTGHIDANLKETQFVFDEEDIVALVSRAPKKKDSIYAGGYFVDHPEAKKIENPDKPSRVGKKYGKYEPPPGWNEGYPDHPNLVHVMLNGGYTQKAWSIAKKWYQPIDGPWVPLEPHVIGWKEIEKQPDIVDEDLEHMGWISVHDAFPENDRIVNVKLENGITHRRQFYKHDMTWRFYEPNIMGGLFAIGVVAWKEIAPK